MECLDIVGKRFGRLTVIEFVGKVSSAPKAYRCKCDCGIEKFCNRNNLLSGDSKSCGCLRSELASKKARLKVYESFDLSDIIGSRFGKLSVEKYLICKVVGKSRTRQYRYLCACDCGKKVEVVRTNLLEGHTSSCGCLKRRSGNLNACWTGHGELSGRHWSSILSHAKSRGIEVKISIEDAWTQFEKQDKKCALTGLSLTFSKKTCGVYAHKTASLDRIDSSKGYIVGNIQWLHKDVNKMKMEFGIDRFIEICELVSKNRGRSDFRGCYR